MIVSVLVVISILMIYLLHVSANSMSSGVGIIPNARRVHNNSVQFRKFA